NGKFAADCVVELESLAILPKRDIIEELSNDLRLRQQQYIKDNLSHLYDRFIWLDKFTAEKIKAIFFANELLDAMPFDIF
ncbi:SAM-dependent methyltransferase, partial [Francisella tularensis]|uniref:SAM-dependent methyltransferase n=1 Tax=Francisella tularensis TaxID=263 RepID=UPI002381A12A